MLMPSVRGRIWKAPNKGSHPFFHSSSVFLHREAIVDTVDGDHMDDKSLDSLIIQHVKRGKYQNALSLHQQFQQQQQQHSLYFSEHTFLALLKACANVRDLEKGLQIHGDICRVGLIHTNVFIGSALIDMYAKCGSLARAKQVFDEIPCKNVVLWTTIITGYAENARGEEALQFLDKMHFDGYSANFVTLISSLKACTVVGSIQKGQEVHGEIEKKGFHVKEIAIGNALVAMYAKLGFLCEAQCQFDHLLVRNVVSWTTIISGYVEHNYGKEALECFEHMQLEGVSPNSVTYLFVLKACGSVENVKKGEELHLEIAGIGLFGKNLFIGSALLNMYFKFRLLEKAQDVFDELQDRNVVVWNSLIGGYVDLGHQWRALKYFEQMQLEGVSPNVTTYVCSLNACISISAIDIGRKIHLEIERLGLIEKDLLVGNALVGMYAKHGLLALAQQTFDKLPSPNVVSWNELILGYAEHGDQEKALQCFRHMQAKGVSPNASTFVSALKASGSIQAIEVGREHHADIEKRGFLEGNLIIGNALLGMYTKCGLLEESQNQFNRLRDRDVFTWTTLISRYVESECAVEAFKFFDQMQVDGALPNSITFICILKACGIIRGLDRGQGIHCEIERQGLCEIDPAIGLALVDMYSKCGSFMKARQIFDRLSVRDANAWSALLIGCAENGDDDEVLEYFEEMCLEGVVASSEIFVLSLKACGNIRAIDKGEKIHVEINKKGLLDKDLFLGSALVDMYTKCGSLIKAQEIFDKLPIRDTISWTSLITGYVEHGYAEETLKCFEQMRLEGVPSDSFTFVSFLNACSKIRAVGKGQEIHAEIEREELLENDVVMGNALVDMYSQCGLLSKALQVFERLPVQNVVSWTSLIAGYAEHEHGDEALKCFEQMQLQGVSPNSGTLICALKACANIGSIKKGEEIHGEIERQGLLEGNIIVGNSLVDMYSKCGLVGKARYVFDQLPSRDIVSWTSLMSGYSQLGDSENVFHFFDSMLAEGIWPNEVTFVVVLNTCSKMGLFNRSHTYFEAMSKHYGITATIEHYTCVVDLFTRTGRFDKTIMTVEKMPVGSDIYMWHTILGACRNWGAMEFGELAFKHALHSKKDTWSSLLQ